MLAAVLHRPAPAADGPLALSEQTAEPVPGPGEVLVEVEACGLCRTDLQLCEGDLPARRLPIVPGHQIVGRVLAVGDGVTGRHPGDRVGIAWIAGTCGTCAMCRGGCENLCEAATFTGWDRDGGFATHVTARADFTYPLPDGADATALAPLLCGGAIGLRSLRLAGVRPGGESRTGGEHGSGSERGSVGLFGFGASATCAIQIARHWGWSVYVATRSVAEQGRARRLGAQWAGGYDESIPVALDAAVTFAPSGDVVVAALRAVRRGGIVAINAIHLDRLPEFPYDLLWWERELRSVANVTRADVVELLRLAVEIPIVTEYETHPLHEANAALARLARGDVRGAAVLVPGATI